MRADDPGADDDVRKECRSPAPSELNQPIVVEVEVGVATSLHFVADDYEPFIISLDANEIPSEVWHAHASKKLTRWSGSTDLRTACFTWITGLSWIGKLSISLFLWIAIWMIVPWSTRNSEHSCRVSTLKVGRRFGRGSYYLLLYVMIMGCASGSEDEVVRASLRQRTQAAAHAAPNPWQARWQWVYQFYGLPQPALGGFYDAEIHRAERPIPWISPSFALRVWQNQDAVTTLQSIAQVWFDVAGVLQGGPMWQFHEAHGSIRRSLVLNEGARHFLLVTYAEERAHLGEAAIFLEIIWNGRGPQDTATTIPWFPQQISSLGILQRAGLLNACTLSHRCDIDVDGSYLNGPATALGHGSFVQIELFPCSPVVSDEEQEPQPIQAVPTPSMSSLTSSYSTSDFASTSESSEHADADEYTRVIHLFRPAAQGRPTHIHALTPPGTRSWRTSVFSAWPRLRYDPWQVATVHRSIAAEYPQQDDVAYWVVIAQPDLPSPTHMVPLVVLHWREFTFFRAIVLPRFATTGHVLAALGLVPFCGVDQEHCPIYHNGSPWSQALRQAIDHGDYIRVAPRLVPFPGLEEHLAQVFNQDDELYRWQHIDLVGTARLRGDSAQAASTVPGPCPIPRVFATTDLYWICMGWWMYIGTLFLLRHLCKKEGHLPPCAIKVVSRRYKLPRTQLARGHRWHSVLLPVLLLSQHFHGSTGLFLRPSTSENTGADLSDFTWPTETFGFLPSADHFPYVLPGDPWNGLPPPGNPSDDLPELRHLLTPHGRLLLSFLEFRCSLLLASPRVSPAFGFAGTAIVETSECNKCQAVNRPIPTPARSYRLPQDVPQAHVAETTTTHEQSGLSTWRNALPEVSWIGSARALPFEDTDVSETFTTDERRRSVDFNCELLGSFSNSQKEVKVLHLDKAFVKQQISLADHLPGDRDLGGDGPGSPSSPVVDVSPSYFAQPETATQPSIVHLPDQDPSQIPDGMCRFPFCNKDSEDLFVEWDVTPFPDLPPPLDLCRRLCPTASLCPCG